MDGTKRIVLLHNSVTFKQLTILYKTSVSRYKTSLEKRKTSFLIQNFIVNIILRCNF